VRNQRSIEPEPAPGVGASVDPLGDGFMLLLPDGFRLLLAPAAEPPALKFGLLLLSHNVAIFSFENQVFEKIHD
jgi:hypothetical protein